MATTRKFIIDNDAGVDDATALFMALAAHRRGDIQILAVTITHGNTSVNNVCVNVLRVLKTVGMLDIPVHRGASEALVLPYDNEPAYHGTDGFNDLSLSDPPDVSTIQTEHAVDTLRRLVRENPGQITLVALGPLTNLAMAIRLEESFTGNLKELFIMGGNTEGHGNITEAAEFNFYCDPEAAHIVLAAASCPTYIIPWELCSQKVNISYDWRTSVMGSVTTPQAELINRIENKNLDRRWFPTWVSCDQLCMAIALNSSVATSVKDYAVYVELHGLYTRGELVLRRRQARQHGQSGNVRVVEEVDVELYKKYLLWGMGHTNHGC